MTAPSPIVKSGPSRAGAEYLKIRDLASGGMGSVELARAISGVRAGQPVVLKRLHPHLEREQQFVSMLLDEAWITAGLHHPNIVEMFDMGEDANGHFLVLEFVAGDSLLAIIRESKKLQVPIPIEVILYVTAKIAEGLHAAHELRNERGDLVHLVHRDVTPSNILLGMQGEVKLIDFGVAKSLERLSHTSAGTIKGKFGYMSPEQARGMAIDRRSDLFSLGVVLWEMLAQRRLYRSESELELLRMVVEEPAPAIRSIRPDVPPSLERLLNASLGKNRDDRLGSCAEFADFLWEAFSEVQGHTGPRELAAFFKRVLPLRCTELAQLLIEVDEFSAPKSVVRPVAHSFTDLPISAAETEAPMVFDARDPKRTPGSPRAALPFASTMLAPPSPSGRPPGGRPRGDTPTRTSNDIGPIGGVAVAGPGGDPSRPARLVVVPDPSVVYALPTVPTVPPPTDDTIDPAFLPQSRSTGVIVGAVLGVLGAIALGAAVVLGLSNRRPPHVPPPRASVVQSALAIDSASPSSMAAASASASAAVSAAASAAASAAMLAPSATAAPTAPAIETAAPVPTASAPIEASAAPTVAPTVEPSGAPTAAATASAASARPPRIRTPRPPREPSTGGVSYEDAVRAMLRGPSAGP